MKSKIEKILIILIIFVIVFIISIYLFINKLKLEEQEEKENQDFVEYVWYEGENNNKTELQDLKSNDEYYIIKNCINEYMENNCYSEDNSFIDNWYISSGKENKITQEFLNNFTSYEPNKIQYISKNQIYVFYVYGKIIVGEGYFPDKECNIMVKLDYINYKYSIIPEIIAESQLSEGVFKENKEEKYKGFKVKSIPNKDIAQRYLEKLIFATLQDVDNSYKYIEEKYKEKKFNNNIENYKQYINNNFNYNEKMFLQVEECEVYDCDSYILYIATDTEGKKYIIKENSVNNFYVLLDDETIILEELLYSKSEQNLN